MEHTLQLFRCRLPPLSRAGADYTTPWLKPLTSAVLHCRVGHTPGQCSTASCTRPRLRLLNKTALTSALWAPTAAMTRMETVSVQGSILHSVKCDPTKLC